MTTNDKKSNKLLTLGAGIGLGLLVGVGMMIGAISASNHQADDNPVTVSLPEGIPLEAGTSSTGKNITMATGPIDEEVEGLFVLDHLTGKLTCFIVNPRGLGGNVPMIGRFEADAISDLGLEKGKETDYVLTVGEVNALRGASVLRPAQCVVYVGDGNTGNVVGYSLQWNSTYARQSTPQQGLLMRVMMAKARPNVLEE